MSDHRQHPRRVIASEVAFQVDGGPRVEARYRDVSLGGMFIETEAPHPYGTRLRVFARLPNLPGEAVIEAIVRWAKPDGMGVQFGSMGARETHGLTVLLGGG